MALSPDFRPRTAKELEACLSDPMWRLCSGALYTVSVKSADGAQGMIVPFRPNPLQMRIITGMWYRNIALKARQIGITTLACIIFLDHAAFNADQNCGILAQDLEAAEDIFHKKIKAVYDRLPQQLKERMPLSRDTAKELVFAHNNSSIRVAVSLRSGTIHRLHISEFGKICASSPEKAAEVVEGTLPTVPSDGIIFIESTAEGRDGFFYKMCERARGLAEAATKLDQSDYRFHFFPWYEDETYRSDSENVVISPKDHEYFDRIEEEKKVRIDLAQRRWYIGKRDNDFSGDQERMWRQYPSTPMEPFMVSTAGAYYTMQLAAARKTGRIGTVPYNESYPVNTFWDIGAGDGTAIWLHQLISQQHNFIGFIEAWNEPYIYYVRKLQEKGYVWGEHWLPHDAEQKRQQGRTVESAKDSLRKLGLGGQWKTVPVVADISHGIKVTMAAFGRCWFDAENCKEGLAHLAAYRRDWDSRGARWRDYPFKDIHSEAADAFRQFGQIEPKIGQGHRREEDSDSASNYYKGSWMAS